MNITRSVMNITRLNKKWISRFLFPRLSIEQRLLLLLCMLLLCVILAFSWISYLGVRKAALVIGRERLYTLTKQPSSIFQQSTNNMGVNRFILSAHEPGLHHK